MGGREGGGGGGRRGRRRKGSEGIGRRGRRRKGRGQGGRREGKGGVGWSERVAEPRLVQTGGLKDPFPFHPAAHTRTHPPRGQAAALAGGTTYHIDFALPLLHDLLQGYRVWKVGSRQGRVCGGGGGRGGEGAGSRAACGEVVVVWWWFSLLPV